MAILTTWFLLSALAAIDTRGSEVGWQEMAESTCGTAGGRLIRTVTVAETFAYLVNNCLLLVSSCRVLAPSMPPVVFVVMHCLLTSFQSVVPDTHYAYVMLFATLCMLGGCATVLISGAALGGGMADTVRVTGLGARHLPAMFTYSMFNVGSHCCYPMIYKAVRRQRRPAMLAISSATCLFGLAASVFGSVGYALFGKSTQAVCTDNVGRDMSLRPHSAALHFVVPMNVLLFIKV